MHFNLLPHWLKLPNLSQCKYCNDFFFFFPYLQISIFVSWTVITALKSQCLHHLFVWPLARAWRVELYISVEKFWSYKHGLSPWMWLAVSLKQLITGLKLKNIISVIALPVCMTCVHIHTHLCIKFYEVIALISETRIMIYSHLEKFYFFHPRCIFWDS